VADYIVERLPASLWRARKARLPEACLPSEESFLVDIEHDLEALQKTADYHVACKKLKQSARGSLIFGVLAVMSGILNWEESILSILLAVIGLVLVVLGLTNIFKPTPEGIIIDGISLLIVALWNTVFVALQGIVFRGGEDLVWGIIGLFQILWSIRRFMEYPRYRQALQDKPSAEELEGMESLVNNINKSSDKGPGYLLFNHRSGVLKGLLSAEAVVFVDVAKHEVMVAHRNEVSLDLKGKVLIGSKLKATLRLKAKTFTGTISQESADKLQSWLNPQSVDVETSE
jgi:hypothetical protein